jgi:hypothetical protein
VSSLQPVYPPPAGRAVEAPWGVAVAESVVQHFASTTTRDTNWTTPPVGALCATQSDKFLWYFAGGTVPTGWKKIAQVALDVTPVAAAAVQTIGDTMTGPLIINATPGLKIRRSNNLPYLQFEDVTGVTRYGYVQGTAADMVYYVDAATADHSFWVNNARKLEINSTNTDVWTTLTAHQSIDVTSGIDVNGGGVRIGGNGAQLKLIDTSTSASDFHDTYIEFFGDGVSMASPGTRSGYVGFPGSTTMYMNNEVLNGGIRLQGNGSGTVTLATGTSGDINMLCGSAGNILLNAATWGVMSSGGAERGRWGSTFMWGKTSSGHGNVGCELFESGVIYATTATASSCLVLRHNTDTDGGSFILFLNSAGGSLSTLSQDDVAPTGIKINNCTTTTPSDYRLKDDLGPMVGALDRVLQLQPKHLAWKETGVEFDGFIAHELATVVPDAVDGDKDAVYDETEAEMMGVQPGDIKAQQLDQTPLIPLLVAAVQELAERLAALEDA